MKTGWRNDALVADKVTASKYIVSDKIPMQYIIPKTSAEGTAGVLSSHNFRATGTAAVDNTGLIAQPPYPMILVVSAMVAGTTAHGDKLTFAGEDAMGAAISEAIIIKGTAASSTASLNAFAKIDTLTPNQTFKSTSVAVGWRKVIGLPYPIESNDDIISYAYDGAYATTAVDELTISTTYNTLTLPAMSATKVISVIYKTKLQE